jgi:hypothetical protein
VIECRRMYKGMVECQKQQIEAYFYFVYFGHCSHAKQDQSINNVNVNNNNIYIV